MKESRDTLTALLEMPLNQRSKSQSRPINPNPKIGRGSSDN
jgi:hypothetical protein